MQLLIIYLLLYYKERVANMMQQHIYNSFWQKEATTYSTVKLKRELTHGRTTTLPDNFTTLLTVLEKDSGFCNRVWFLVHREMWWPYSGILLIILVCWIRTDSLNNNNHQLGCALADDELNLPLILSKINTPKPKTKMVD